MWDEESPDNQRRLFFPADLDQKMPEIAMQMPDGTEQSFKDVNLDEAMEKAQEYER